MDIEWKDVGNWLVENGSGLIGLAGSVATGNVPGAVASVASMFTEATGEADPKKALKKFQDDPAVLLKLEEIAAKQEEDLRIHHREMLAMQLNDKQKEHETTQATIQAGDRAEDRLVRWTRPLQSWCSLVASFGYVAKSQTVDITILGMLLALPWAYAGLRQVGKGIDSMKGKP